VGLFWGIILGAIVGWIGSLVTHATTSEDILLHIGVGLLGALGLELLMANSGTFDNLAAAYVGAVIGLCVLWGVRRVANRGRG
jgi:uncharacterized membrane protein YeaQ/YmgE (transglycosylase-associated protein family)